MKNIIFAFLFFIGLPYCSFCQLFINTNADLIVNGEVEISLLETNFENNGIFTPGIGTVLFKGTNGTSNTTISGSAITSFHNIDLNLQNHALQLLRTINVSDTVSFVNGNFELNNYDVLLGTDGLIEGESGASTFKGDNGGSISKTVVLNAPTSANPGNLGAIITSTSNLGSTTITRGHQAQINGNNISIKRTYDISPTTNSGLNATLRFHYFDSELNGIPESDLELWRFSSAWQEMGFTTRDAMNDYVELTGIDAFSMWTLFEEEIPLPVELSYFRVSKLEEETALLEWESLAEFNNEGFFIERATRQINGSLEWAEIDFISGQGNSFESTTYEYVDQLPKPGTNYYRLKQIDFNGNFEYSDVRSVFFENEKAIDIGLVFPNPVFKQSGEIQIPIFCNTSSRLYVDVKDQFGKTIFSQQAEIEEGGQFLEIDISQYSSGIYFIIINLGAEQFGQKFIVQSSD